MRSCRSRICSRKRVEDNHVRFIGGREEDAVVGALVIFQKIANRDEGVGRRRWRKRTSWHCFLILGDLRRTLQKQEEDDNSENCEEEMVNISLLVMSVVILLSSTTLNIRIIARSDGKASGEEC